jgi:ribosomal protein L21
MDLKNNVVEQREYLVRNLEKVNTVMSAVLGVTVKLQVVEHTDYRKNISFKLEDNYNFRDKCGIMAKAFTQVTIENYGMWWRDNGVCMSFDFNYEHIDGGRNGAKFCTIEIIDDFVKIR